MKIFTSVLLALFLFSPIANADDAYDEYRKTMDNVWAQYETDSDDFYNKKKKEDLFDVIKTPSEDRVKIYKEKKTNDIYNGMSPKGKTSQQVLFDLFKSN